MSGFSAIKKHHLPYQLTQIELKELSYLEFAPCDVFTYDGEEFHLSIPAQREITRELLKELLVKGHLSFFVPYDSLTELVKEQQDNLRHVTRSLSMGNEKKHGVKQLNLLSMNMSYLYKNPTDDDSLQLQYQSLKNLSQYLTSHSKNIKSLFHTLNHQNFHFTITQPLMSSLLLLAFLKSTYHFNDKEIENLFITSYFKDIGMAIIPKEKYDKQELTESDKKDLFLHSSHSSNILSGRLPLSPSYLDIIQNHHSHSLIVPKGHESESSLMGIETMFITLMDMITAMTSERPYRDNLSLYEALELVKKLIGTQHPQEFKFLVNFFHQFFKK